jgi:hypothetical protein
VKEELDYYERKPRIYRGHGRLNIEHGMETLEIMVKKSYFPIYRLGWEMKLVSNYLEKSKLIIIK